MKNSNSVDQKLQDVLALIASQPQLFARQGSVVASYRTYRQRRLGPYYRLTFRASGVQRAVYLGRCPERVRQVRALLAELQRPGRQRRVYQRQRAQIVAGLRRAKQDWARQLRPHGLLLKGYEVRHAPTSPSAAASSSQPNDASV